MATICEVSTQIADCADCSIVDQSPTASFCPKILSDDDQRTIEISQVEPLQLFEHR
jgi:hypothetical protein